METTPHPNAPTTSLADLWSRRNPVETYHPQKGTHRPDFEQRLRRFRSRRLTDQQQRWFGPAVCDLVMAVPPATLNDALVMASQVSRFLSDVAGPSDSNAGALLTDDRLAQWISESTHDDLAPVTVSKIATAVRRVIRVQHGLPGRLERTAEAPSAFKQVDWNRMRLLVVGDEQLTAMLVAAYGCGLVGKPAEGATVMASAHRSWIVASDGSTVNVVNGMESLARSVAGVTVVDGSWRRLQHLAAANGLVLTAKTTRTAWLVGVLETQPVLNALAGRGHNTLTKAVPHLRRPDEAVVRQMLRGEP